MPTELEKAVKKIYEDYTRRYPRQAQPEEFLKRKATLDAANLPELSGLKILEVGPGGGHLATLMHSRGASVSVLDLVDTYINQLEDVADQRFNADIQSPFAGKYPPEPTSFNLITMCDVLEHVVRPGDALLSAKQLLATSGLLYVRSPSWETLTKYALQNGCETEMAHLRTYTKELLIRELRDSGFQVISAGTLRTHNEPRFTWSNLFESLLPGEWGGRLYNRIRYGQPIGGVPNFVVKSLQRLLTRPGEVWALAKVP